jgi:hypothetical protein
VHEILFCTEVPFSRLNGRMAQEQLDLLKLPARTPAQLRAATPVMPHAA